MVVPPKEAVRGAVGGGLGIAFAACICLFAARTLNLSPWLVAPLGASAVLVFAVPSSPLAQPWPVVAGNTVSAIVGLLASNLVSEPVAAASLAVGLAIASMIALRCLHPPGGAMALLVVLTQTQSPVLALFPAFTNSALLVVFGVAYHALTRHSHPHVHAPLPDIPSGLMRITEGDLAAAMTESREILDISAEDLSHLVRLTEMNAFRRMAGQSTCADIMSKPAHIVHFGTHLDDAWKLMQRFDIKALPVIDRSRRMIGLLTSDGFLRAAMSMGASSPEDGLAKLLQRTSVPHSDKPEVAGQIMSENFTTAYADSQLTDVLPLFSGGDRRHVVILNSERRVCGIISTSDAMRALFHKAA